MNKRHFLQTAAAAVLAISAFQFSAITAAAQEVTLRLHQFLPEAANVPQHVLIPWAERVGQESGGRLKIEVYSAMSLGGTPPQLFDQAKDGVVDIVWALPGYTPGRFPRAEVFELPFTMTNPEATSRAYWELFEAEMKDQDFQGIKILGTWVHGPGVIHARGNGVESIADMEGMKMRGPTRVINAVLSEMGAEPIGMPVPAIPEALSKGVIDGTVIPWEVTPSIKVAELVDVHTEFSGDSALYTATFVLAMNQAKYDSLPDDLKKVLDDNSGLEFSALAGKTMGEDDAPGRKIAEDAGNRIIVLDDAEVARWREAAQPVIDNWISEMDDKGIDGQALYDKAQELTAKHTN